MDGLKNDNVIIQVRDKLQKDGVKLWLSPYYSTTGPSTTDLNRLAQNYSDILELPYESCYAAICELQTFALDKLKQRDLYRASGIATLRVKLLNHNGVPSLITYETSLKQSGDDLKKGVLEQANVQQERIKLIANGKVIQDNRTLLEQGVQNGQQILALLLSESVTDIQQTENQYKEIESVKADTQLLATEDNDYMELEDQAGNPVQIPDHERKALMVAMALHEKGRSALKRDDYSRALVFFLDSDNEYSHCNSDLLNLVDNYALLDLDIAWCYLCLQSVNHLPEAFNRLKRCEQVFEKTYGPNLERLIAVKGSPGNEAVLFLRLHLLQGIVLFHQNKRSESFKLLKKVEDELRVLKVDENSVIALMELGYSAAEARLGLRATHGDVNLAANYINENREKRAESRRKAMAERILYREQKKLGKCIDGNQYVNPTFLKMLVDMGYNKEAARIGLQRSNNIISDCIQYIQENPGPSASHSQEVLSLITDLIPEALKKYGGDIMKAADELLSNNGIINFDDVENGTLKYLNDPFSVRILDESVKEKKKLKEEAFARLAEDISMVDDDHLDLTLQQEEQFLKEYMSLLNPI
ncbi:hypothetical protein FQR65_LT02894 [Abscondita terminalis]|nr:hypothetical protein FQR65_LT02894 [Abscondita terminalis]